MVITSARNRRLKDIRRLRECKGDRALLEGAHLLGEALDLGLPLSTVLVTPEFVGGPEGRRLTARLPTPPTLVTPGALASVAESTTPRGVLGVAELPRRGIEGVPLRRGGLYVFVEGVQDPGNLGALARVAEAAGADAAILAPGTVHPNHPRALRASAGSLLRLPVAVEADAGALAAHLEPLSPTWCALAPRGGTSLLEAPLAGALVLAVGSEGAGLTADLAARCDTVITIPMRGRVESLNVTVAAALVLFERLRRASLGDD